MTPATIKLIEERKAKLAKLAQIMNPTPAPAPAEKRFIEFCQETVQNGKYNLKAIFALAWREVKNAGRSLAKALSYAWDIAKSQMQSAKRNKNLDLRAMGFTRLD